VEVNGEDRQAVADYCRQIESYLCQKNGGHLIRVVGPAFEEVRGWARRGIPLKIAFRGIDQCCERRMANSTRRRPIRIEFCAVDILQLFDDWQRAVGVSAAPETESPPSRKPSLASHIERVVARLIALRGIEGAAPVPESAIEEAVRALDRISGTAQKARGDQRQTLVAELATIDQNLVQLVAGLLDDETSQRLRREAEEELAAFGTRMPPDAKAAAVEMAYLRLVREAARLPRVAFD
jgi:hypothetical protein